MTNIIGISGNGPADVNDDHQLLTKAIVESEHEFVSDIKGLSFVWDSGNVNIDATDTVLLVKNTSATLELHIDTITISTQTDSVFQIQLPTAEVTPTGTTVTGTVLNTRFSEAAPADAKSDETNNSQGNIIWTHEIQAAGGPFVKNYGGVLIIKKNGSVGVDQVSDAAGAMVTIEGHFTEKPG